MFRKILVATDGSDLSDKAVRCAIELARIHQAELVAVTVVPRYHLGSYEGAARFSAEEIGAFERRGADEAQSMLDGVAVQARAQGVRIKTVALGSDQVAQALLRAAGKHECDLVVMASHGRKGLQRLLLGSETLQVLIRSSVPVLVLR